MSLFTEWYVPVIYKVVERLTLHPEEDLIQKFWSESWTVPLYENPAAIRFIEADIIGREMTPKLWRSLSKNQAATHLLETNIENVNWASLCTVETNKAISLIKRHLEKLDQECWINLSRNVVSLPILSMHLDKVSLIDIIFTCSRADEERVEFIYRIFGKQTQDIQDHYLPLLWEGFSKNPAATAIFEENRRRIFYSNSPDHLLDLCRNKSEEAMHILEGRIDEIKEYVHRNILSHNSVAVELLERYPDKICWDSFCRNPNPKAVSLFLKNTDKLIFLNLLVNINVFFKMTDTHLSVYADRENTLLLVSHKIDFSIRDGSYVWEPLCANPSESALEVLRCLSASSISTLNIMFNQNERIFSYDYSLMLERKRRLIRDFYEYFYHPSRIEKYLERFDGDIEQMWKSL